MSDEYRFSTHDPGLGAETNDWGQAVWLQLRRYRTEPERSTAVPRKPVLLLHGASANHGTFTVGTPGLAGCLYSHGLDPWMLDWRGSSLVVDAPANSASLRDQPHIYNFNRAAAEDLPAAIEKMRQLGVNGPVSLLGHCMGGAVAAEAIALGHLEHADVDRVVLLALGLFYEAPIDSRLKSEERILEHLTQIREHCVVAIDPRVVEIDPGIGDNDRMETGWPPELKNLYDAWPGALRSHAEDSDPAGALCNRLSFMYGMPYHHQNLVEVIHDQSKPELLNQFGAIPLRMYLHAARNLRRGHATFFEEETSSARHNELVSDKARERFQAMEKVTLITGALNRLWHRDSVDRMYEWLCRGPSGSLRRFHKRIFLNYAHQDLLWGRTSDAEVYPEIVSGLQE